MARILLAAGGTGGHIMPALAVAEELKRLAPDTVVEFVGTGRPLEAKLIGGAGYRAHVISFVPVSGGGVRGLLRMILRAPSAMIETRRLFKQFAPSAVMGFGGYPAAMPLVTALLARIPRVIAEANVQSGIANKLLSVIAQRVFAVPGAEDFLRTSRLVHLPNPVRRSFLDIPDWKFDPQQPFRILIVGGSQGAMSLNRAVLAAMAALKGRAVSVVHQSGESDQATVVNGYKALGMDTVTVRAFIDSIADEYRAAHLVICRAGAMTAAEVSAAGRPAIFVPLPIAGGHQSENVRHLVAAEAAFQLDQNEELGARLSTLLPELIDDPHRLEGVARRARAAAYTEGGSAGEVIARELLRLSAGGR